MDEKQQPRTGQSTPNSPKNRIIRLIVGMVIITLGIVIFNVSSKMYKEAEAKDAEKAKAIEKAKNDSIFIHDSGDSQKNYNFATSSE